MSGTVTLLECTTSEPHGFLREDYERSRLAFSGNAHLVDQILGNLKAKADGGPKRKELVGPFSRSLNGVYSPSSGS